MIEIRQTETFSKWLLGLRDRQARARIQTRIDRLQLGLTGDVKPVGEGVSELRIDYGLWAWVSNIFYKARTGVDNSACRR